MGHSLHHESRSDLPTAQQQLCALGLSAQSNAKAALLLPTFHAVSPLPPK
jgi:hypothetical protein